MSNIIQNDSTVFHIQYTHYDLWMLKSTVTTLTSTSARSVLSGVTHGIRPRAPAGRQSFSNAGASVHRGVGWSTLSRSIRAALRRHRAGE